MTRRSANFLTPEWSIFRRDGPTGSDTVAVPRAPLLVRLRRMIGEEYFAQPALAPLKRFMEAVFVAGPVCILAAYYMETWSGVTTWLGIACLAVASLYWFAPHFLCRLYLGRRGYRLAGRVEATDHEAALAKGAT